MIVFMMETWQSVGEAGFFFLPIFTHKLYGTHFSTQRITILNRVEEKQLREYFADFSETPLTFNWNYSRLQTNEDLP